MDIQDQIKYKLETIFNKYKFTLDQRASAVMDLIKLGEAKTIDTLSFEMSEEQKTSLNNFFSPEMKESDMKKVYDYLSEIFTLEKVTEVRGAVYDTLITEYIQHMNL
ncbi:MAG: hypothetical protein Q8L07_01600 [Sediminibacterium sp.]|nr:hypothetical protein [Sediminibacterium sp.]MDP1812107.1 hypothetical protein [Sediminibacterium sp.]MDP3127025.1 hypothetical protein [Sediminibacterium sp.]